MCALPSTKAPYSVWLMVGIVLAALTDTVNSTLSQVAGPEATGSLSASADEGAWFGMIYTMGRLFAFLACGRVIEKYGSYRVLIGGMGLCMGLSSIMLMGPGLWGVLICRALQGIAGGSVTVAAMTALVLAVPRAQHAWAQGAWGVTTMLGPSLLAYLCGSVTDAYGWRAAGMWQVVIGTLAMLCLSQTLGQREPAFASQERADWAGMLMWATAVVTSQFIVARGTRYNWSDVGWMLPLVWLCAVSCAALLMWHRFRAFGPKLTNTAALRRPEFVFACVTGVASSYGSTATAMLLPLYARSLFGFAAADLGAVQLAAVVSTGIGLAFGAATTARRTFSAVYLIYAGMFLFGATLLLWSNATWQVDDVFMARIMAMRGLAFGLMAVPTAVLAFARLFDTGAIHAIGLYQTTRQLGASFATLSLTWRLAETKARFGYQFGMHLVPGDPIVLDRLMRSGARLKERGLLNSRAPGGALAQVRLAVYEQVAILAYNACFLEILYVFGTCMAVALLARSRIIAPGV